MRDPLASIRLHLEVEALRHQVVHALVDHQGAIQKQVEAEIDGLLKSGHLEQQVRTAIQKHFDQAIDEAVRAALHSWVRESPTIKQAIQESVAEALRTL
jgi:hypothetical protein